MNEKYSALFTPWKIGNVEIKNRIVQPSMGGRWLYQNKKMFKDLAEWLPEFHKTGSKLFVQLSAGMGRSMAIQGREAVAGNAPAFNEFKDTRTAIETTVNGLQGRFGQEAGVAAPLRELVNTWNPLAERAGKGKDGGIKNENN